MFKHTTADGRRNLCGEKIHYLRKRLPGNVSQRKLSEMLQVKGIDVDKTAVRRMENGERYITDIEIKSLCEIFNITSDELLGIKK